MQDIAATVRFLHENGATYGLDPTRMGLTGCSGGSFVSLGAAKILADSGEANNEGHVLVMPNDLE
jgi:acetyl esterase/lipase